MMNTTKLVFIILSCAVFHQAPAQRYNWNDDKHEAWGWKEYLKVWPPMKPNGFRFYDRISLVIINIPNYLNSTSEKTILVPSVLISSSQIVTAYNPFRDIIRNPKVTDKLVAAFVQFQQPFTTVKVHISEIVCGRQVVYMPDEKVEHWHGADKMHSPVHDLMVLRVDEEFKDALVRNIFWHDGDFYTNDKTKGKGTIGPIRSYLAGDLEKFGDTAMVYSLGYRTKREMRDYNYIHPYEIKSVDLALVNCEEWMPRQWGYFICFKNEENFKGLGAGAMLYSKNKLFGVGSFALFRNETGILVFTDIRPYKELLLRTCSDEEFTHEW